MLFNQLYVAEMRRDKEFDLVEGGGGMGGGYKEIKVAVHDGGEVDGVVICGVVDVRAKGGGHL